LLPSALIVSVVISSVLDFFMIAEEVIHSSEKSTFFVDSNKSLPKLIIKFASRI
jgi:hypothetical protein